MSHLTKIAGVPDSDTAIPGMAYFAGTGPENKTCGDCIWRGYYRKRETSHWDEKLQREVVKTYKHQGCEKFRSLTGRHGPIVDADNKSCKYFESRGLP